MRYYPALIEPADDGGYGIAFPDFPGCVSIGATVEQTIANGAEALLFHIEGMEADGELIPDPSPLGTPLPDWLDGVGGHLALVPVEPPGDHVRLNITLPRQLVGRIDRVAGSRQRSRFLAEAADRALRERSSA
jgi:predicted RNase H-like HicB family nuclease